MNKIVLDFKSNREHNMNMTTGSYTKCRPRQPSANEQVQWICQQNHNAKHVQINAVQNQIWHKYKWTGSKQQRLQTQCAHAHTRPAKSIQDKHNMYMHEVLIHMKPLNKKTQCNMKSNQISKDSTQVKPHQRHRVDHDNKTTDLTYIYFREYKSNQV